MINMALSNDVPSVSVIINTDGRVKSLATCLESLRYLRYPNFEVIVVAGPTQDGTHELCRSYGREITFAECPYRNLSISRNISIQISAGEFVGFLDDDSVPEAEWLDDVMPAFQDPQVAVAGGFLHDHTGKTYQWTFGTLNRFGTADTSWKCPAPQFNFPGSFNYPHVMANSLFRRSAIAEVGGFDEEYEYFLDESDIILRFVDQGWKVAQLDIGFVHHKFMPSHIRNEARVLTSWYSVIKNKTYFSLLNGAGHTTLNDVLTVIQATIQDYRGHVRWAINHQNLVPADLDRYEDEVNRALRDGLSRGLDGKRKLVSAKSLQGGSDFTRFVPHLPAASRRCYVLLTRTYPPGSIGGIGRYVYHLATELAKMGHQVHVLTAGTQHDRVDFESGVWVHRICIKESTLPEGVDVPAHIWNYSNTMYEEACAIASRRLIHCVCAPIWDVEGIAFLIRPKFTLVTSLHTTLATYLASDPDKSTDDVFIERFAKPMLQLEERLLLESDAILANSNAIVEEIEKDYEIRFDRRRLSIVPHGIEDWTESRELSSPRTENREIRVCFIGRLEPRKGADVFLSIAPRLMETYKNIFIDIVGNDQIPCSAGTTYRSVFEDQFPEYASQQRLTFHGEVSEERLREIYHSAEIVVAPSRFESFGLVHLEAMMYGKPVIGCNAGGMREIIENEITGLLVTPGDADALLTSIERLLDDEQLRERLGRNARASYLSKFTSRQMANEIVRSLDIICPI
jgi:glycosyltransferase involved in cell wall biosynthesis/GT2 family glycosyltransferase